jgi:hypothetical protein
MESAAQSVASGGGVNKEFLRPSDLAPLLGVTSGRVCQRVTAGVIPATRRGWAVYIRRVALGAVACGAG